jgi:transcriptional regulator with XRE-family HTH domain
MTQAQLARAAGILRPNLSRIESGKHRPSVETLEKIAAALKLPVVDLILRQ